MAKSCDRSPNSLPFNRAAFLTGSSVPVPSAALAGRDSVSGNIVEDLPPRDDLFDVDEEEKVLFEAEETLDESVDDLLELTADTEAEAEETEAEGDNDPFSRTLAVLSRFLDVVDVAFGSG